MVICVVSHGFANPINRYLHPGNRLLGEAILDLAVVVDTRCGRFDLEHEIIAIRDLDGRRLVIDFRGIEAEFSDCRERRRIECGTRGLLNDRVGDEPFVVDGDLQHH
jgi:hypothetical protein